tara:strand:+ start:263 stop:436 length:174 start_codon:yes stop_codon:yes gene_type:complete
VAELVIPVLVVMVDLVAAVKAVETELQEFQAQLTQDLVAEDVMLVVELVAVVKVLLY